MINAFLVLISAFVVNIFWAFYIKYTADNKMVLAAVFGEMILICGAVLTYNYVSNLWMLIPAVTGGFFGTLFSNKIKKFFKLEK